MVLSKIKKPSLSLNLRGSRAFLHNKRGPSKAPAWERQSKQILNKPQKEGGKSQTGWRGWYELSLFHLCLSLQQREPESPTQGGILLKMHR